MPRIGSRYLVWAFTASLGLWAFFGQGQEAAATLSYRGSWGSTENDEGRFIQDQGHYLALSSGRDLVGRLTSQEYVNYSYRWEQGGVAREALSPGASLKLAGDIYNASLAVVSVSSSQDTRKSQTDSLGFVWGSAWTRRMFPVLTANYDYSRQRNESLGIRGETDRQNFGTQVNWDLLVAQLFYSYRLNSNNYSNYIAVSDSNLARVDASRDWLDNRLQVSVGYEYSKSTNEQRIPFTSTSTVDVFLALPQADAGPDLTPTDTDDSTLAAAPYLLNDVDPLLPPAYSATAANNSNCIRLRTNGQQVDRIFLYTQNNLGPLPTPLGVGLRVYYNDNILINPWTEVVAFAWRYESSSQRFIIDLPAVRANYVKLVVDLTAPLVINFTEVQAQQVVSGALASTLTTIDTVRTDRSTFSVNFRPSKSVTLYYNLLIYKEQKDFSSSGNTESHSGGLLMQNSAGDLKSTLNYSLSRQRGSASSELYALSVSKILLPTLTVAMNGSLDGVSSKGVKISDRIRYGMYADAVLYPDLNSRLETIYTDSKSYESGAISASQDDLDVNFALTSRFSPSLTVSLYDNYKIQNQTGQVSKKQTSIGLSGSWQVSDLLSMYATVTRNTSSAVSFADYLYSTGLVAGSGSGFELQVSYSMSVAEIDSQSGRASLRWVSNRNVTWEIGGNYAETDAGSVTNAYKFYTQVGVNFATR